MERWPEDDQEAAAPPWCQDPTSARYDGMPRSAIALQVADFILPPDDIARELLRVLRHPYVTTPPGAASIGSEAAGYQKLFRLVHAATGIDFSQSGRRRSAAGSPDG